MDGNNTTDHDHNKSQLASRVEGDSERLGGQQASWSSVKDSCRPGSVPGWVTSTEGPGNSYQPTNISEPSKLGFGGLPPIPDPIGAKTVTFLTLPSPPPTNILPKKQKNKKKKKY